jgi:hypothetical protein
MMTCPVAKPIYLLLLPEFEKAKEEPVSEVQEQDLAIEQEIECPRCHDVMTPLQI